MLLSGVWNGSTTTESSATAGEPSLTSLSMNKISQYIWYFGAPVILLFGNFGNIMTIIIMRRMRSGDAVINIYFTALAVIDLITLDVFLLGQWTGISFGYFVKFQNNAICKIYNWVTTGCTTIGGWFLVGLTAHRAVSVLWPHRVHLLCTRRLVIGVIVGMAAFFAAVYSHYLYGYNLHYFNNTNDYHCTMMLGDYVTFVEEIFTYIDMVLYSLLPFTCILIANGVMAWKLRAHFREIRHTFVEGRHTQGEDRERTSISITATVILLSVAYVVMTLPMYYVILSVFVFNTSVVMSSFKRAKINLMMSVTYFLMFCNSAVNFYLYCLTGERFRKEFKKLFCPERPPDASVRSMASSEIPASLPSRPAERKQ